MNKIKPYLPFIPYSLSAIIAISFLVYEISQPTTKEKEYTVYSENKVFENLKRTFDHRKFSFDGLLESGTHFEEGTPFGVEVT